MCIKISTALTTGLLALSTTAFSSTANAATAVAPQSFTCIAPVDLGKVDIILGNVHYKQFSLGVSPRSTAQDSVILRLNYTVVNNKKGKRRAYFQMFGVQGDTIVDFVMNHETIVADGNTATEHVQVDTTASPTWNVELTQLCYRADAF